MKKTFLACCMAAILSLTACVGTPAESPSPTPTAQPVETAAPPEFTLPYDSSGNYHPITGENRVNQTLVPLLYEGLFSLDESLTPQPCLSQSHTVSEDGLVWTFQLREGAQFSDGTPLTGKEAARSLEAARTSTRYAARLAGIKKIRGVEGGVEITLSQPNGALPSLLDTPIVLERDSLPPLGTGRYALKGTGREPWLERQSTADPALPETIKLTPVEGVEGLVNAFDTRVVSLVTADLTAPDVPPYAGGYESWDYATTSMVYLGFRTDGGPCQDPALRRGISMALNRDGIVDAFYSNHARAAVLPVSPVNGLYGEGLAARLSYDPEKAAAQLEQAGYLRSEEGLKKEGRQVSLTLVVNQENPVRLSVAGFLEQELGQLGISLKVRTLAWEEYTSALKKGNFDLYLSETVLPASFDLTALLGPAGELNYGHWKSEAAPDLLQAFQSAQGEERQKAAAALYSHLIQEAPLAPLCFKEQSVLTQQGRMTGLTPTRADPFYGDGWTIQNRLP